MQPSAQPFATAGRPGKREVLGKSSTCKAPSLCAPPTGAISPGRLQAEAAVSVGRTVGPALPGCEGLQRKMARGVKPPPRGSCACCPLTPPPNT